jgi:hypothetical protein
MVITISKFEISRILAELAVLKKIIKKLTNEKHHLSLLAEL